MMNRIALPLASLSLVLAGCSQQSSSEAPVGEATSDSPTPDATVTDTATPPADAGATDPLPTDEAAATTIPAAIQGRWGLVPADCTSTRGDAKGLLTVDARTLKFYESRATLGKIDERSDTRLRATFSFSGEGMTWSREETLAVAGDTLTRTEKGGDEPGSGGPFVYTRCPA